MNKPNKVIVEQMENNGYTYFKVSNYGDIKTWDRDEFFKELKSETLNGNVTKVIDHSVKKTQLGKNYTGAFVSNVFIFKNNKKYESIEIKGPKDFFEDEEIETLNSIKSVVKNLRFSKNIKKLVVGATLVAGLSLGTAHYINSNPEVKAKLDKISYNVSVNVEESFRSRGLYDLILADLYKISVNEQGQEFITPYSDIIFESLEQEKEFIKSVKEEYEIRIQESNVKRILDNNKQEEVYNKYFGLIETFRATGSSDPAVANNVLNNLTKEEVVALSEYKTVFSATIYDLAEEKGLIMGHKGNVR
jgi:hypothetical protein